MGMQLINHVRNENDKLVSCFNLEGLTDLC